MSEAKIFIFLIDQLYNVNKNIYKKDNLLIFLGLDYLREHKLSRLLN